MIPISVTKNDDLLPVEPEKRTWRGYNYVALCVYRPTLQAETWRIDATSSSQLGRRHVQRQYVSFMLVISSSPNLPDNVCSWMIVSSMIQLGMSWWHAWICVWLGYSLVTPFLVLNARPGAVFHITFPVVNRTSFGIFGSLWCVFNRGAMAW